MNDSEISVSNSATKSRSHSKKEQWITKKRCNEHWLLALHKGYFILIIYTSILLLLLLLFPL